MPPAEGSLVFPVMSRPVCPVASLLEPGGWQPRAVWPCLPLGPRAGGASAALRQSVLGVVQLLFFCLRFVVFSTSVEFVC